MWGRTPRPPSGPEVSGRFVFWDIILLYEKVRRSRIIRCKKDLDHEGVMGDASP
jgi:hypothetical protein